MSYCHIEKKSTKWGNLFDVASALKQIEALEGSLLDPDVWSDTEKSQKIMQEIKACKRKTDDYNNLLSKYEDILTLIEMGIEESDNSVYQESKSDFNDFIKTYEDLRISTLFSGEFDKNNAILALHAGAGGTEACDWVSMIFRMFTRFCEKMEFSIETLDIIDGEEAGIKSVTFQVTGENAFGYLKSEKGVHRLVRISPFDSSGRRHTSFASCDVMPEIDDNINIEIKDEDLKIDTYRSGGAGGQHVNKTESAIRITHLPSGIVVQCQNERSQYKNKDRAMKVLRAKLFEKRQQEQLEKLQGIRGEIKEIGWGSQIRSYVFHPYNLVKDHRTNTEVGNINSVMDGNLLPFINSYLNWLIN